MQASSPTTFVPMATPAGFPARADAEALRSAFHRVMPALTGFTAPPAAQEQARRDLGRLIEAAQRIRISLPDAGGLRVGTGASRAARAVATALSETGVLPDCAAVAALLEVSPSEARGLLLRAVLKGWVCETERDPARLLASRWGLTRPGMEFTGCASADGEARA